MDCFQAAGAEPRPSVFLEPPRPAFVESAPVSLLLLRWSKLMYSASHLEPRRSLQTRSAKQRWCSPPAPRHLVLRLPAARFARHSSWTDSPRCIGASVAFQLQHPESASIETEGSALRAPILQPVLAALQSVHYCHLVARSVPSLLLPQRLLLQLEYPALRRRELQLSWTGQSLLGRLQVEVGEEPRPRFRCSRQTAQSCEQHLQLPGRVPRV
mmetsp:Transcript_84268/g.133093  ORF Transcript_84268/g.133093 Transcript_84268/m.133093 type:complete len:213 (-) Transcript_84268:314-952(-)